MLIFFLVSALSALHLDNEPKFMVIGNPVILEQSHAHNAPDLWDRGSSILEVRHYTFKPPGILARGSSIEVEKTLYIRFRSKNNLPRNKLRGVHGICSVLRKARL